MARRWTKEEKDFLKENYTKMTTDELAKRLDRSNQAVLNYAKHILGIVGTPKAPKQRTDEEDEFIIKHYHTLSYKEMAKELNMPFSRVSMAIYRLRMEGKLRTKQFSTEDENFLRVNKGVLSVQEMAEILGRTESQIYGKMHRMGLVKKGGDSKR